MDDVHDRIPRGGRLWVALVTRRRRPLFVEDAARERVEAAVRAAGEAAGCRMIRCEVWPAEVRVCVESRAELDADDLVLRLREAIGSGLARRVVVSENEMAETACKT